MWRTPPTSSLERAYAEPHRRYHSRRHVDACLEILESVEGLSAEERRLLAWAIWWHDAVYRPDAPDNEARSAALARRELPSLGATTGEVETVARLIELTATHPAAAGDRLGALMVSIDLAVLGAPACDYDRYVAEVRAEFAHLPEDAWRLRRRALLQRFLHAAVIFPDPVLRRRLEAQARANLGRELASLDRPWPRG